MSESRARSSLNRQATSPNGRRFSDDFKRDAVRLVVDEGYTFKAAAKAVGVSEKSLRDWHKRLAPPPKLCGEDTTKVALFIGAYGNQAQAPAGATIWVDDVFVGPVAEKSPVRVFHSRVKMEADQPFTFHSPVKGTLDYLLMHLWDRTEKTPATVWTPMDVYRETVASPR